MIAWQLLLFVFIASAAITGGVRSLALHRNALVMPVPRSAHTVPTPVGGGLGIVVVFYAALAYSYYQGSIETNEFMALLGGIIIAVTGVIDDLRNLDVGWRLPAHILAAVWALLWLGSGFSIPIFRWQLDWFWLITILSGFALVWLTNLYNFMDGIDGIAASEACFVNLVVCLIVVNTGDSLLIFLSTTLFAASSGFLLWNWPPAKVFMGDVGSAFLGYCFGVMALLSMLHNSMNLWTWVILLGVFIVDATVTLLQRLLNGEKWYEGHSSHAYQHATRHYGSHRSVTVTIMLINLCWLAPLAWFANKFADLGVFLALIGVLPLLMVARRFNAGKSPQLKATRE